MSKYVLMLGGMVGANGTPLKPANVVVEMNQMHEKVGKLTAELDKASQCIVDLNMEAAELRCTAAVLKEIKALVHRDSNDPKEIAREVEKAVKERGVLAVQMVRHRLLFKEVLDSGFTGSNHFMRENIKSLMDAEPSQAVNTELAQAIRKAIEATIVRDDDSEYGDWCYSLDLLDYADKLEKGYV